MTKIKFSVLQASFIVGSFSQVQVALAQPAPAQAKPQAPISTMGCNSKMISQAMDAKYPDVKPIKLDMKSQRNCETAILTARNAKIAILGTVSVGGLVTSVATLNYATQALAKLEGREKFYARQIGNMTKDAERGVQGVQHSVDKGAKQMAQLEKKAAVAAAEELKVISAKKEAIIKAVSDQIRRLQMDLVESFGKNEKAIHTAAEELQSIAKRHLALAGGAAKIPNETLSASQYEKFLFRLMETIEKSSFKGAAEASAKVSAEMAARKTLATGAKIGAGIAIAAGAFLLDFLFLMEPRELADGTLGPAYACEAVAMNENLPAKEVCSHVLDSPAAMEELQNFTGKVLAIANTSSTRKPEEAKASAPSTK